MTDDDLDEEALRRLLRPRRTPPRRRAPNLNRARIWVATATDREAFVRALRHKFPSIVFVTRHDDEQSQGSSFREEKRPWECGDTVIAILEGSVEAPTKRFEFSRSYIFRFALKDGRPVETLSNALIRGSYWRTDREMARLLGRVFRISEAISTKRLKWVDRDDGAVLAEVSRGTWCGFDALRWAQGASNRLLGDWYRPTDDWVMPDSPWYD